MFPTFSRNSLSEGLIAELHAALDDIGEDANIRAVVIAATGPAFSAGHDMKELTARLAVQGELTSVEVDAVPAGVVPNSRASTDTRRGRSLFKT